MTRTLALRNRQRSRALRLPLVRRVVLHLLDEEFAVPEFELCFHFVSAREMARVNWDYLEHEGSTDVITFDLNEPVAVPRGRKRRPPELGASRLSGEIFISVADAMKQAREFRTTWPSELVRYIIHGLLHLRGYDDLQPAKRRVMKREENRLLQRVCQLFPAAQLARDSTRPVKTPHRR